MSAPPGHNGPPSDADLVEAFMQHLQGLVDDFGAERIRGAFFREAGVDPTTTDTTLAKDGAAARAIAQVALLIARPALGRFAEHLAGDLESARGGRDSPILLARDPPKGRVAGQFDRCTGVMLLECLALLIAVGWKNENDRIRRNSERLRREYGAFKNATLVRDDILAKLDTPIEHSAYVSTKGTFLGRLPPEMRAVIDAVAGLLRPDSKAKKAAVAEVEGNAAARDVLQSVIDFWGLSKAEQMARLNHLLRERKFGA